MGIAKIIFNNAKITNMSPATVNGAILTLQNTSGIFCGVMAPQKIAGKLSVGMNINATADMITKTLPLYYKNGNEVVTGENKVNTIYHNYKLKTIEILPTGFPMGVTYGTIINAVLLDFPVYHPPYINKRGNKGPEKLIMEIAINENNHTSKIKNIIMWGKYAHRYSHMLYIGKIINIFFTIKSEWIQAKYNNGDLIIDVTGEQLKTNRNTITIEDLILGHDGPKAINYLNKRYDHEIKTGVRLPEWDNPSATRTNGPSDYEVWTSWYKQYINIPYAGQKNWFGHASIKIWPSQSNLCIEGQHFPPPINDPKYGDYIMADGRIIPYNKHVYDRAKEGNINPLTEFIRSDPESNEHYNDIQIIDALKKHKPSKTIDNLLSM